MALRCNGPRLVQEGVSKRIGVGITYLASLKTDLASDRFVVLKGADFQFTTLSYIVYSNKHELSPAAQEFLGLLRAVKRIPNAKELAEITGPIKSRVLTLPSKSRHLIWLLAPVTVPWLDSLAEIL